MHSFIFCLTQKCQRYFYQNGKYKYYYDSVYHSANGKNACKKFIYHHIKPDMLNLIEEKVTKSFWYLGTGENFLNRTPMAYALRATIDKWDQINCKDSIKQGILTIGQNGNPQIGKRYLPTLYPVEG